MHKLDWVAAKVTMTRGFVVYGLQTRFVHGLVCCSYHAVESVGLLCFREFGNKFLFFMSAFLSVLFLVCMTIRSFQILASKRRSK